jgi:hypothetical protein
MTNTPDTTPEVVERFARTYNGGLSWDIVPNHEGEWVRYSDYATLSAERDALIHGRDMMGRLWEKEKARAEAAEAEVSRLREALMEARDAFDRGEPSQPPKTGVEKRALIAALQKEIKT